MSRKNKGDLVALLIGIAAYFCTTELLDYASSFVAVNALIVLGAGLGAALNWWRVSRDGQRASVWSVGTGAWLVAFLLPVLTSPVVGIRSSEFAEFLGYSLVVALVVAFVIGMGYRVQSSLQEPTEASGRSAARGRRHRLIGDASALIVAIAVVIAMVSLGGAYPNPDQRLTLALLGAGLGAGSNWWRYHRRGSAVSAAHVRNGAWLGTLAVPLPLLILEGAPDHTLGSMLQIAIIAGGAAGLALGVLYSVYAGNWLRQSRSGGEWSSVSPRMHGSDERVEVECPYCAETILAKARYCKHCHRDVPVQPPSISTSEADTYAAEVTHAPVDEVLSTPTSSSPPRFTSPISPSEAGLTDESAHALAEPTAALHRIGGWLAFFAVTRVLVVAALGVTALFTFNRAFTSGASGGDSVKFVAVVLLEAIAMVVNINGLRLLWRGSPSTPRFWCWYFLASTPFWAFVLYIALVGQGDFATPGGRHVMPGQWTAELARAAVYGALWLGYWMRSKRVEATFGTVGFDSTDRIERHEQARPGILAVAGVVSVVLFMGFAAVGYVGDRYGTASAAREGDTRAAPESTLFRGIDLSSFNEDSRWPRLATTPSVDAAGAMSGEAGGEREDRETGEGNSR